MNSDFRKANVFFKNGDYKAAVKAYKKAMAMGSPLSSQIEFNIKLAEKRLGGCVELSPLELEDEVFIGIAAIPERVDALEKTIQSLLGQASKIGVYLNNWKTVPDFLKHEKITLEGFGREDLGDIGKFFWCESHKGFYLTCDDDLVYPPDYVERTVRKIRDYNYKAAVGWHGSLLLEPFKSYYDKSSRRVFTFSSHRPWDTPVHILGTGCSGYHTDFFSVRKSDFVHKNMADVFFALNGQLQSVPFIVIEHDKNEIRESEGVKESSIYSHSHKNEPSKKNTHKLQNEHVIAHKPWVLNEFGALSVLVIGRFESYAKGGIFKSCHLIKKHLEGEGHKVDVHDTQNPLSEVERDKYDLCWIYPGDPERPDFQSVYEKIAVLREGRVPTIVNLSYLYESGRSEWIKNELLRLNEGQEIPVLGAVFTESAANDKALEAVREYLCVVPKTIEPTPFESYVGFEDREGICLGDATKLSNPKIIGGEISPWIEAIHKRLPHVNLYAYKQYQGENPHPKIKYVPHMKEGFGEWLAKRRLFICLNVHLTFEMVACEAQSYGTPVVYRHMPHSLSEYISATGLAVRNPDEMAEMVAWLYNSQRSWSKISKSSVYRAKSNHVDVLDASLEGYLRLAIHRVNSLMSNFD